MAEFQYTPDMMEADNPPSAMPTDSITESLTRATTAVPTGQTDIPAEFRRQMAIGEAAGQQMPIIESERSKLAEAFGLRRMGELERLGKAGVDIAESAKKEAADIYKKPEHKMLQMPEFTPSQASVGELITMFTMVNTMAMLAGGKGRSSGMAALASLNGALDGYKKGRQDIYKMEMINFDKNLKALQQVNDTRKYELEKALKEVALNKDVGLAKLKEIELQMKGSQIEQDLRLGRYDSAMKKLDMLVKAGNDAANRYSQYQTKQQQMQTQKEIAGMRMAMSASRLSPKQQSEIQSANAMRDDLVRLRSTFNNNYANFVADTAGDLKAKYNERIKQDNRMAGWWREYEQLAMLQRHEIFGATLTGGEKESWRKATIGPGNSSQAIKQWIDERIAQVDRKLAQYESIRPVSQQPLGSSGSIGQQRIGSAGINENLLNDIGLN